MVVSVVVVVVVNVVVDDDDGGGSGDRDNGAAGDNVDDCSCDGDVVGTRGGGGDLRRYWQGIFRQTPP